MTPETLNRAAMAVSLLLAVVIAFATLLPPPAMPPGPPGGDKLHHFVAFAALVFPVVLARPRAALWAVPLAAGYGGVIELIQPSFGRSRELADAVANTLGALGGAGLAAALHPLLPRHWRGR